MFSKFLKFVNTNLVLLESNNALVSAKVGHPDVMPSELHPTMYERE